VHEKAQASLARYAAIVLDERPDRLIAVNPFTGVELVAVRSETKVLAVGINGVIIADGRDIAYVRFTGVTPVDPAADPGDGSTGDDPGSDGGPDGGPQCGGPKQESCSAG
jgi:hypothetical protein